jgi:hypothetical protein
MFVIIYKGILERSKIVKEIKPKLVLHPGDVR